MEPLHKLTITTLTPDFSRETPEEHKWSKVVFNIDNLQPINYTIPHAFQVSPDLTKINYSLFLKTIDSSETSRFSQLHIKGGCGDRSLYDLILSLPQLKTLILEDFNLDLLLKDGTKNYYPSIVDDFHDDKVNYPLRRAESCAAHLSKVLSQNNITLDKLTLKNCRSATDYLVYELIKSIPSLTQLSCEGTELSRDGCVGFVGLIINPQKLKELISETANCRLHSFVTSDGRNINF